MELDDVQVAAQAQFARQSKRYGAGHILADISDVEAAISKIAIPDRAEVLDAHHRLLSPLAWSALCGQHGLAVRHAELSPFQQPDLEWYFETAATVPGNREKVRQLVTQAPASARRLFQIGTEGDKVVWWWPRLTLCAEKEASVGS